MIEIFLVLVFVFIAGYLAAAEIAIASFGTNKIEELEERKDKLAGSFEYIQKESNAFFGTIQILTYLFLTAASILAYLNIFEPLSVLIRYLNFDFTYYTIKVISFCLSIILVTPFIVIFAILIPKAIGFKYAEKIARNSVKILLLLTTILKYPIIFVNYLSNIILIPFKEKTNFTQTRFSEDEIRIIISEGVKSGAINETEQEIIENIFEFNDLRANEVLIPRTDMIALEIIDDYEEIKEVLLKSPVSHIPVYKETIDNIIGVLHTRDFFKALIKDEEIDLEKLLKPAYFVPESKLISEVLKEMQKRGERLAIVMDEYGGTEGCVTMENLIAEIVGEFDSGDSEEKEYYKTPDGKFYVQGSMFIEDFNNEFNMDLPFSDEYNTVAGFIADATGKILEPQESYKFGQLNFELVKKIRQKMVQFKVYSDDGSFGIANKQ